MERKQNENRKEFAIYTALNVLGMIGLSCYILADTFFVSKGLGANGLAALNLAIPVYSFVHGCGLMLGMGGATKYSILRGQRAHKDASRNFTNTVCLAAFFIAMFMILGGSFSGKITALLGADAEVYAMTRTYIRMILLFAPAFIMNDIFICFVRNDGNPKLSMMAMLGGSFSNIILDYIFIFPFHMGIFGAVLATGFAPVISMGILSRHLFTKKNQFHLAKPEGIFASARNIFSLGIPSLVTEAASGLVIIIFNIIIFRLEGNIGVAAYGVVANLSLVVTSVFTGIAQGMQPIVSRAYGIGDRSSIKQIWRYAVVTVLVLSACIYVGFWSFAGPIAGVFNSEQNRQLQQIAVAGLKLYFTAVPFVGYNIVVSMYFTSTEKGLPAQVVSLTRGIILIVPMAFLLSALAGMTGVWLSYPVTEAIVACMGIALYCKARGGKTK